MRMFFYGALVLFSILACTRDAGASEKSSYETPQCGQFCIYHICRLKGVPLALSQIMEILSPKEQGESLLDLSDALERLGFRCKGLKYTLKDLQEGVFPLIAHLEIKKDDTSGKTGHFVVVERADSKFLKVFTGDGSRSSISVQDFIQLWDGYVLVVTDRAFSRPDFLPLVSPDSPQIQFDTLFFDAGDIPQEKDKVIFEFPFQNTGNSDLVIEDIQTSCGCTVVDDGYRKRIPPGEGEIIQIEYKFTEERRGAFNQSVLVKSNDPAYPKIELTIVGNGSRDVIVTPPRVDFGEIVKGQKATHRCYIRCNGDSAVNLACNQSNLSGFQFVLDSLTPEKMQQLLPQAKIKIMPDCFNKYVLDVSVDTSGICIGKSETKIELTANIDGRKLIVDIPVVVSIVQPIRVVPSKLFLGEIARGDNIKKTVVVESLDQSLIQVVAIDNQGTKISASYSDKPAKNIEIEFAGVADNQEQILNKVLTVHLLTFPTKKKVGIDIPISGLIYKKSI